MAPRALTGGWCLFVLAALIPGVRLQKNDSSVQPATDPERLSGAQVYRPVLQPSEATPPTGTYTLKSLARTACIKVAMGVEFVVKEKEKTWYFNLDPTRVKTSGYCGKEAAVLSLTLRDNGASLQLTFKKEKKIFYITKLTAHLSPLPACRKCANKTYSGLLDHGKLFRTADGQSFTCKSENVILMSSELSVKLVPLKLQAFTLPNGGFGKELECWADFNKRVIPIVVGAVVVALILIAVLTFLFIKDRRRQDYDRI